MYFFSKQPKMYKGPHSIHYLTDLVGREHSQVKYIDRQNVNAFYTLHNST